MTNEAMIDEACITRYLIKGSLFYYFLFQLYIRLSRTIPLQLK